MERTWGPPFSQYSQYSFKPREHRVLREDAARSLKLYKIPPLSLIESTLYISSCGTDGPGTADDRQRTVATILGYMVATAKNEHESVLEYYYGFLCLRRLLHLTCRYVLKETDSSDHEGGFLQQGANENDVFQATAFAALDKAAEASASESRFERFCNIFTHSDFLLDRTAREWFTTIPFRGLWGERDRVLSLCVQGLLPGFSLLLLAMVTTFSQDQREHKLVQDKVSTKAEQFELAQLITDAEVISLSGRILLLIFFEGRDFDTMEFAGFQDFIDKLDDFQEAVYKSVSAFPGHFNSSKIEWAKTMAQLDLWLALGKFDGFDRKEGGITMQVLSSARVWRRCTNVMVDFHIAIQHCAYPRCFQLFTRQGRLRVRYMCQKCNTAVYCDTNCQRA
ncbi:hypothetical protein FRC09_006041 [Ceratobasidium sp. 395]|nr:hypothetical protein FRC09_006041 [Ceratobasidium sp. 395]